MYKRAPQKPLPIMDRRVQKSDKYAHVKGTIDTGLTVEKVQMVTSREYSKRRDEIYFRLKRNQLSALYKEYENQQDEDIAHSRACETRVVTYDQYDEPEYEQPYLILDVRQPEEFQQCHLLRARSFPYTMLRRDQLHPDIYKFRNKPETLIVVYCDDEKISREAAKVLVDRGTDNIFLLTGGIIEFAGDYPEYVEGMHPATERVLASASATRSKTNPHRSTRLGSLREDEEYGAASSPNNRLTPRKLDRHNNTLGASPDSKYGPPPSAAMRIARQSVRSDCGRSTASTKSVAESVISRASARKGKF